MIHNNLLCAAWAADFMAVPQLMVCVQNVLKML